MPASCGRFFVPAWHRRAAQAQASGTGERHRRAAQAQAQAQAQASGTGERHRRAAQASGTGIPNHDPCIPKPDTRNPCRISCHIYDNPKPLSYL